MTYTQLIKSINGIEVLSVYKAEMSAEWNAHSVLNLEAAVSDKNGSALERLLYEENVIEVNYQTTDGKQAILYSGYVKSLKICKKNHIFNFKLCLTGMSNIMDRLEKVRVFQNKNASYQDVVNEIIQPYGFTFETEMQLQKKIGQMFVQYHESDWEFLQRVLSHLNTSVYANYLGKNKYIIIGLHEVTPINISVDHYQIVSRNQEFLYKKQNGINELISEDSICYQFESYQLHEIGSCINLHGKKLYIDSVHMQLSAEELVFHYVAKRKAAFQEVTTYNKRLVGAALDGIIADVKNDIVKVHILEGDKATKAEASWIPYSTVYSSSDGTGWYCMPEIGDSIRAFFPNEIENNCYVISSVHANGGNMGSMRSNPDNKCIATKYGKQIELTPSDIRITNGKGMLINISDSDGIIMVSGEDINLSADGNISLISATDTVDICAAESIVMKQGDNTIKVEDEITFKGSKIRLQ